MFMGWGTIEMKAPNLGGHSLHKEVLAVGQVLHCALENAPTEFKLPKHGYCPFPALHKGRTERLGTVLHLSSGVGMSGETR